MSAHTSTESRADPTQSRSRQLIVRIAALRAWLFLALLLIFFETWSRVSYGQTFLFSAYNAQSIAIFAVAPLLLALGSTFVIISGGIDLSVGFIMGLAAVIAAHATNLAGHSLPPFAAMLVGILAGLLVALGPGFVNGFLISKLKVPPFIGTLGMFGVARGVAFLLAGGTTVPVANAWFASLGNGRIFGIPVIVVITILFVLLMHYVLSQTRFGQHTYAIGANEQAAIRSGINVPRHIRKLYLLSALCAGLGGVLYAARFTAGAAQAGEPLLLDSIAAVVIGGASLFGGSGTILGTVAGALVIAVIQYGLVFINVEPFWQFVAVGVVIIISVLVDQTQRKLGGDR
ncbi:MULTISPECIES: ABC transporter permease subunit [Kaistia]|uniref:Autoinducer 2 import system permease protein LsrD n=1 Tax=Kaistia nematophila TaxID=2994654 RepID=A0A9X3IKW9_9HYPH|nr:ribose ABC transporter [Kaistia nematophila]MBN9026088.1 ribose ABC transporter [Hyphomicrobiales bacterium]MCX5568926.1 ribose ABC transporter [Kaistia nematophila]